MALGLRPILLSKPVMPRSTTTIGYSSSPKGYSSFNIRTLYGIDSNFNFKFTHTVAGCPVPVAPQARRASLKFRVGTYNNRRGVSIMMPMPMALAGGGVWLGIYSFVKKLSS